MQEVSRALHVHDMRDMLNDGPRLAEGDVVRSTRGCTESTLKPIAFYIEVSPRCRLFAAFCKSPRVRRGLIFVIIEATYCYRLTRVIDCCGPAACF